MSAIISKCGRYRYRLERDVQEKGLVFAYIGINPSTADASIDDATVRKWKGFALANGCSRFLVGNIFAFRATDVGELKTAIDPIGEENARHLREIFNDADIIIPCWGSRTKIPKNLRSNIDAMVWTLFHQTVVSLTSKPLKVFGFTKSGDPMHPQMLAYSTKLIDWL